MERKIRNANDQRYKATHALLRATYKKLLSEKDYRDISVTELCQHTHINRGTFYLHYRDSLAVMEELEDEIYAQIIAFIDKALLRSEPQDVMTRKLCDYILTTPDGQFLGAVLNGIYGTGRMYDRVCDYISSTVSLAFAKAGNLDISRAQLFTTYLAGGSMAVLRRWHRNGYQNMEEENTFCNQILNAAYEVAGIEAKDFHHVYFQVLNDLNKGKASIKKSGTTHKR